MDDVRSGQQPLHLHTFGATDPKARHVLALHGLTGHGRRWGHFADTQLPDVRVLAPDLLGHGHSSWEPPWAIDDQVVALAHLLDQHVDADEPVVIVAHSFGSAIAIALAAARPTQIVGLLLLDPAQGLDPSLARTYAELTITNWGYPDADAAVAAKRMEGWAEVPDDIMAAELADHLIAAPDGGAQWRVSPPATSVAWSEMARPHRLPPVGIRTHVVVADRVQPPFVSDAFLADCADQRAESVQVHRVDTEHMVPYLAPDVAGRLARDLLDRT